MPRDPECTAVPPLIELAQAHRWGGQFQSVCKAHEGGVVWWRLHPDGLVDHVHLTWQQAMMIGHDMSTAAIEAAEVMSDLAAKEEEHGG